MPQLYKRAVIDAASLGDNTVITGVPGKILRVYQLVIVSSGTTTVRFESGASGTALTGQMTLAVNTGFAPAFCPAGHFQTAVGALLNLELSAAVSVDGWVVYSEVVG